MADEQAALNEVMNLLEADPESSPPPIRIANKPSRE